MEAKIADCRREVESLFQQVLDLAESKELRPLAEFESMLWTLLLATGRALSVLFLTRRAALPRAVNYRYQGRSYRLEGMRTTCLKVRFGRVSFTRPVGRLRGRARGVADLPVDRELGLCSGFSLGVVLAMARLCAQMAFQSARDNFTEVYGWAPSSRAVLRMVDAVGGQAKAFLEASPAPVDDGEILVIQVDGRGAPMISPTEAARRRRPHRPRAGTRRSGRRLRRRENPKVRRKAGDKSKNGKVAVVGVLYTLSKTPDGMEGPINKRLYATFQSHRALFKWLRKEADKRGYGQKSTLFLGDGSDHIWRMQAEYFPDAEVCLDWFHVVEKIWLAGRCVFDEGAAELKEWVSQQTERLRRGRPLEVVRELRQIHDQTPSTGTANRSKRKRLGRVITHLEQHKDRLRYDELRRRDLDIGTGAVEGAVRNLIAIRLDGPGMRWGRGRAELVLHLRCVLLNGQWGAFAKAIASNGALRLLAQPIPAVPHEAKKRAA